jgi:DNA-binding XRE family transcriptional regulator
MKSDSASKNVLRCAHCDLRQFAPASGFCRRCHRLLNWPRADSSGPSSLSNGACLSTEHLAQRIGAAIKILRKERRLSQERLASKIGGISRPSISKLESGKVVPSLRKLQRVTTALGIDIAELFLRIRK